MTIIERILKTADEKNIKQAEIAKLLNKGTAQITSWKKRGCNPPAEYIPAIAQLLEVSVQWLMTGNEVPQHLVIENDEMEVLNRYRRLSAYQKRLAKSMLEVAKDAPEPDGTDTTDTTGKN